MKLSSLPPGTPERPFVAIDPGKRCGVLVWTPTDPWGKSTVDLDDLPHWMAGVFGMVQPVFVGVEDYSMTGGQRYNDPKMPAAQGIGMAKAIAGLMDVPLILLPRNAKRAGHQALDADGAAAFATCKNDHQRDVVDLAGFVLRELRAAKTNSDQRTR